LFCPSRNTSGSVAGTGACGFLPPGFFRVVRDRFLAADRGRKGVLVTRTE
jgi:hypothetical protein